MNGDNTVRQAMEGLAGKPGPHPDADQLVAYHEGTLPPGEMQRIQDHLVACRECAGLLADLEGLGDPGFGAEAEIPEGTGETVWEGVRQEIRGEGGRGRLVLFPAREPLPGWVRSLAAMLVISTMALSGWVAHLRDQVEDLSGPQLNAPILDLYPAGPTRGEGPAVQTVPADARLFTVVLNVQGRPAFAEYEIEILEGREVVLQEGGLKPNPYGSFSATLSRDLLGHGDFRVRLVGIGSSRHTIEEYALRIEGP